MDYCELVGQLRAFLGLPPLDTPAGEPWALRLDEVVVNFHPHDWEPAFSIRTVLGVLRDETLEPMASRLLAANLVQSCGLGADAHGTVYLTRHVCLQDQGFARFKRLLETFVSVAEYWQAQFARDAQEAQPEPTRPAAQEA